MQYIIGVIIILLCLFITGYYLRKKYYKEIDRLESWKIDVTNRPVSSELTKVKQLNITGQTEEMFERWRNEWDEIAANEFPVLEELLFDAEEFIDKYRFGKAKEVQKKISEKLTETETKIEAILTELNDLVSSEEKNRLEIEELQELYRELRKTLLAHRHNYGKSEVILEKMLDEITEQFVQFEENTDHGNYLQARELVLSIKNQLDNIKYKMDSIPNLLVECQSIIPSQIDEIREGYRQMLEQGYVLHHLHFEKETAQLEDELNNYKEKIEQTEVEDVEKGLEQIKESIELFYDLLEKEVYAKHTVQVNRSETKSLLEIIQVANNRLKEETLVVQQSYQLLDNELELERHLEKQLTQLHKRFEIVEAKLNEEDTAQTIISEELLAIKAELEHIQSEQENLMVKLQTLRKDEISAREKIKELTRNINEVARMVERSNVPGLPIEYEHLMEDATESIENVFMSLDEKPLNMAAVQKYLDVAVISVTSLVDTTTELIENMSLAEKVIQYGNRYRSKYPSVAKGLDEAEMFFRSFDYRKALEQAATSIEEVEPGAINKIEKLLSE